jgi:hypothetical protein
MTCPCWSIARYRYVQRPEPFTYVSSTNHLSPRAWRQGPGSFDELGGETLHPPVDGPVIYGDTALGQLFLDVTVREAVPQVPADRDGDHLPREPETSEHRRRARRRHRTSLPPAATEPVRLSNVSAANELIGTQVGCQPRQVRRDAGRRLATVTRSVPQCPMPGHAGRPPGSPSGLSDQDVAQRSPSGVRLAVFADPAGRPSERRHPQRRLRRAEAAQLLINRVDRQLVPGDI